METSALHLERSRSLGEEIANAVTHGVGAVLSLVGTVMLLAVAIVTRDPWRIASAAIYGASLFALFLSSTLYHAVTAPRAKRVFKVLDHVSIYLLIAGTYTPFTLLGLKGRWGWSLFIAVWTLAIAGLVFKLFFTGRFGKLSVGIYVAMGWLVVIATGPALDSVGTTTMLWFAAGGALYTVGVVFYALKQVPYMHTVWHLFVLGGSVVHFLAVLWFLMPARPA